MKDIIKIKLLNHIWTIRFLPEHLMRENDSGTCWGSKRTIDIDKKLTKEEIKRILVHELVHAFFFMGGRSAEKSFEEETICEFVAWNIDSLIEARDKIMLEAKL